MKIYSTKFKGLKIIKIKKFSDLRGSVIKVFNQNKKYSKFNCFESYISFSKKGTIRGLHGQLGTHSQEKLIYCLKGKAIDLAVDMRIKSKTYGMIFKKNINSKNSTAILIPKGFVHGLLALEKETIVVNFCSKPYNPKKEFGINFKSLKIKLPRIKLLISRKDKNLPDLHLVKKK